MDKSKQKHPFLSAGNTVAIYTILSLLLVMRSSLGLEAMLEYISGYLKSVDQKDPDMKPAVQEALALMSVEKIYKEVL